MAIYSKLTAHSDCTIQSVTKTTVLPLEWLLGLNLGFLKLTVLAIGNETWDDYRSPVFGKKRRKC